MGDHPFFVGFVPIVAKLARQFKLLPKTIIFAPETGGGCPPALTLPEGLFTLTNSEDTGGADTG
jgi:hypothetical protein